MTTGDLWHMAQQQKARITSKKRELRDQQYRLRRRELKAAKEQAKQVTLAGGQQVAAASRMEGMYRKLLGGIGTGVATATATARSDLEPWRKAGTDALGQLQTKISAGPGDFKESPGYQFRLGEGQKAIERSAAARGGALSGAAVKAGMRYGQEFATADYDNFLRRYYESMTPLERMSGQGMEAARGMGQFSLQGAGQADDARFRATQGMAGAAQYGGESLAGGTMNAANIMAAQQARQTQRDVGYNAWKRGGLATEQANRFRMIRG